MLLLLTLAACDPQDSEKPHDTDLQDADGDGLVGDADCDDTDPDVGEPTLLVYDDADSDGYGDNATFRAACSAGAGETELGDDCDDADPSIHPEATELCDGIDQDCDDTLDDGATTSYYADTDGDGFGDGRQLTQACAPPDGWVIDSTDCDDASATTHPGADEVCDGADNDCDGETDEGGLEPTTWYTDADGDGFGDPGSPVVACTPPSGVAGDDRDCDDTDPAVNPDAEEVCGDEIDEDCDGTVVACGFGGVYDLGADDVTILGDVDYEQFGSAVVSLGDVDGDGRGDLPASAEQSFGQAGRTFVVPGASVVETAVDTVASAIWSGEPRTNTGSALAAVGDVTGDGTPDLLIGASQSHSAWIVSGTSLGNANLTSAHTVITSAHQEFGIAVSAAGDVDGDGTHDFLVGSPNAGETAEGAVYLFRGPLAGGDLAPTDAFATFTGSEAFEHVGYGTAGGHDLDGDGLADPVSATFDGTDGYGNVWVVYDPAGGDLALTGADVVLTGSSGLDEMAMDVASVGDTDGDGYGELLVGAWGDADDAGAVYVIAGPPTSGDIATVARAKYTGNLGAGLGATLADVGDLDADGLADLAMGAPLENAYTGAVYVVYGPGGSGTIAISGADASFTGSPLYSGAGAGLAAGDVSGDGKPDLLVTAPQHPGVVTYGGALHVIFGE